MKSDTQKPIFTGEVETHQIWKCVTCGNITTDADERCCSKDLWDEGIGIFAMREGVPDFPLNRRRETKG